MKQIIKLSESTLNGIIKESVKKILKEISIRDKYNKEVQNNKTQLDYDTYNLICSIDPTSENGNTGKYCNWLLAKLKNINTIEINRIRHTLSDCLRWFNDKAKVNQLLQIGLSNDINQFKTYDMLIDAVNEIMRDSSNTLLSKSEYNQRQKLKGQFEIIDESKCN